MQLNKDIDQCPFILAMLCKIQKGKYMQVNWEEGEEEIRVYSISSLQLLKNNSAKKSLERVADIFLCCIPQIYISFIINRL